MNFESLEADYQYNELFIL